MALRQEDVQVNVSFITDESRRLAQTLNTTKQYNQEVETSRKKIEAYQRQLKSTALDETKRAELLSKVAVEEKKVADNLTKIATEGKKVQALDLTKVTPAQLTERAKQLALAMRSIPQSAPEFRELEAELVRVNTRLRELRTSAAGAPAADPGGGGIFGRLLGGGAIARFLPLVGQVVAGVQAIGGALRRASDAEQLRISFETFLGSAEKAKAVIADLKAFEVKTPFEAEQVNAAGRALLAFGFSSQELIPTLTAVGDVAAGTGKDFNELALIYGKARAQGLIQGEELNQLAEAGIPIYAELAKVLGVNESQIRKLGEQGKIQFEDLEQVFQNLTGEGGRFNNLMEKQSQSLGGLYSTLKSALGNLFTDFGNVLAPLAKGALELLIGAVTILGNVARPMFDLFQFGFNAIVNSAKITQSFFLNDLPAAIGRFIQSAEEIPGIGRAITLLLTPIRLLIDAFESLPATASGVVAALTDIFTTGGANAGKAYADARNAALREEQQEAARDAAEAARDERQLTAAEQAAIAEENRKKAAKLADERKNAYAERLKAVEAALQKELKGVEVANAREELLLENQRIRREISEAQYQNRLIEVQRIGLDRKLAVFKAFHRLESEEALKAQNELEQIQRRSLTRFVPGRAEGAQPGLDTAPELAAQPTDAQTANRAALAELPGRQENAELALREKFNLLLDKEQEYELARLELKRQFLEEELALLRSSTEPQAAAITDRESQKRDIELQISRQRLENQKRLQDLEQQATQQSLEALGQLFQVGADLLLQDEKNKKKHASAIKAFQIAQVQVSLFAEVAGIFENAQKSPVAKLLGPVAGNILAVVQAAIATARAGIAIGKIQATKFAGGGYTGLGYGLPDSTGFRPAGIVHEGEYVIPKRIVEDPRVAPVVRALETRRLRGFAEGGLATLDTTPLPIPTAQASQAGAAEQVLALDAAVKRFERVVAQFPTEVKSRVVYTELEEVGTEINAVRDDAAI